MLPLSGTKVVESAPGTGPAPVRRAIAFAGRVAADLGARVVTTAGMLGDQPVAMRRFLEAGKTVLGQDLGAADLPEPTDVVLADAATGIATDAPVGVTLSLLPEGAPARMMSEFTVMAAGGLLEMIGDPDRPPLRLPGAQMSYAAGLSAYTAAAGLLLGGGGRAGVSLLDVATWLNWKSVIVAHVDGRAPGRAGRGAEWQVLRCKDGWVALVYRQEHWEALKGLLADPALDAPHLQIRSERRRHATALADIIERGFSRLTRAELSDFARRNRVPLGVVREPEEVVGDPQSTCRAFFRTVGTPEGAVAMPRLPVLWNGAPLAGAAGGG